MHSTPFRYRAPATLLAFACAALAALNAGCAAASRGVDPTRPRAGALYPVALSASEDRGRAARDAWARLLADQGIASQTPPELRPVTATLAALPSPSGAPLRLPSVGGEDGKAPTEEETRESLRRFLASAATPLGALPSELSLVSYEDAGVGLKRAIYQQNPFEYPLRGGYGRVEITFTPDRRVTSLSSTAIPDAERLRRALAAAPQDRITAEKAAASLAGRTLTYADASGNTQTRTVAAQGETSVRELVVYPLQAEDDPSTLELHLAWEIAVGGGDGTLRVYIDAVTGVELAATNAPEK